MANDLENSIRSAAEKIAAYVDNIATMTVETKYVKIDDQGDTDFSKAKPVARTVIRIDGDSEAVLPVRESEDGGLAVDADLLDLHNQNVVTAIDYRAKLLNSLIGMLKIDHPVTTWPGTGRKWCARTFWPHAHQFRHS